MARYDDIRNLLYHEDPKQREQGWKSLQSEVEKRRVNLVAEDYQELRRRLVNEPNADVRSLGLAVLAYLTGLPPSATLLSHFWEPFLPGRMNAVLAIVDKAHNKDVDAYLQLGRFFPSRHYSRTEFRPVSFAQPDKDTVGIEDCAAVCFIGRPGMYHNCNLLDPAHNPGRSASAAW